MINELCSRPHSNTKQTTILSNKIIILWWWLHIMFQGSMLYLFHNFDWNIIIHDIYSTICYLQFSTARRVEAAVECFEYWVLEVSVVTMEMLMTHIVSIQQSNGDTSRTPKLSNRPGWRPRSTRTDLRLWVRRWRGWAWGCCQRQPAFHSSHQHQPFLYRLIVITVTLRELLT